LVYKDVDILCKSQSRAEEAVKVLNIKFVIPKEKGTLGCGLNLMAIPADWRLIQMRAIKLAVIGADLIPLEK